ncbi:MAG: bifunctional phosphopantothenoylcysteine decarboxylase/phosphopantothenate--cysteine ligase CoaBC [Anaerovibrio sp.]|uniref:bifunctional phosphopantothenoylcysteine decarboxylase/phosphopantothenate--cysteine ligase CoaBC n=1 Tax=Anaerovibrio sp. TaxID=1872532 RepID=UPI001B0CA68F|nr:bifunctional phosphopantothenoylcysteine decarboxylase/phosphopantothenate--cysteine ligase CoaBC [Anaerovibrio sp.]MBO5588429.1 bifunctional phosphopantothenoylcysteine decarboxylase/phosphopantothenate--cysteine ligase CoaBC [Anaerovibrio sp.]MBO6245672.1 bifunctional phosphopantothenoylcysteine decarboxylase/phosphopantothenate--cysteine ligase CoaBC [Anaerovibrio sp.]
MLKDKNVILGVTGGIAAYKSVDLASRLRKAGANVHVIMTKGAQNFVTPLTFREITGNPVTTTMWGEVTNHNVEHIALANLADLVIVAPATANFIAKCAMGMADDMLTTTLLATKAPIFFAPAMNSNMYENQLTQKNIDVLIESGWNFIPPESGHLACGTDGVGRMPEPADIVDFVHFTMAFAADMLGIKVLVTAAGTYEPIDPVRYIGNRSSGKMGYAIAEAAKKRGAEVILVSGPSALTPPDGVEFIGVESAAEMRDAVMEHFSEADMIIKAAAVADYRVRNASDQKIKKNDEELTLVLEKNPDILKELGEKKRTGQILVGFAAETQNLLEYAKAKLEKKNLDMIVANDVSRKDAGFNTDTNVVKLLYRNGTIEELPIMTKHKLADELLNRVLKIKY